MSKKLICFMSLVLLLGMTAVSPAGLDDDPNLVGWWKFDGDTLDSSSNGLGGVLVGDAHLVAAGLLDGAVSLDGSGDYVTIPGYKGINADRTDSANPVQLPFSVACWVRTANAEGSLVCWGSSDGAPVGGQYQNFRINLGTLRAEHGNGNLRGSTVVSDGEWHHVAQTVARGANLRVPATSLYVDGVQDSIVSGTGSDNIWNLTAAADVGIGVRSSSGDRLLTGMFDDVRIYNRVLDASEVALLATRPKSYAPDPADGALVEATSALLQWKPGGYAAEHDVYLGTNPTPGPDQLVGRQSATVYMAMDLAQEQTYYWRIDDIAVDGTVHTGDVWSLWVPPQRAYNPQPENGLINVATDAKLNWTGGWSPIMHAVYFGTDANTVAGAAGAAPQMNVGFDPGPLALDTTYYWRVDEFYGAEWVTGPVWSFKTLPPVPPAEDVNLVAWYTLDEGAGKTAIDWSGHNGHGQLVGGAQWAEGTISGALEFDGSGGDYVQAPQAPNVTGTHSRTVAAWIKTANYGEIVSWGLDAAGQKWIFRVQESNGTLGAIRVEVNGGYQVGSIDVRDDQWHHVAAVLTDDGSPDATEISLYVDGFQEISSAQLDEPINTATTGVVRIGQSPWGTRPFRGRIDDVRIYDKAFTRDEMRQTFGNVLLAWDPQPAYRATVDVWTTLSWTPGDGAAEHDVYIGTYPDAVAAADVSDTTGIYRGRQTETTYVSPVNLNFDQQYYWRIDEVAPDGTVSKGLIWMFTTTGEIVIYDVETPLPYDNSIEPFVSEISLDLDPAQNWTRPVGRVAISYTGQAAPGSVTTDDVNGTTAVAGRGADIWGTADQFQFAHTMLTMNGSMTVKIESLAHTHNWTKAGLMVREALDPGSAFAAIYATGANGVRFQARAMAGTGATGDDSVATAEQQALVPPVWLKIERMFPMVNAYYSTDGVTWTPMAWNPQIVPMSPAPIYIGLAVTSHSGDSTYAEAVFSNIASDGGVAPGPLASTEIGLASNSPEPMYLVLEDASGASAAVLNPDPAATQQGSATDWIVDLDQFAIDRTAITKASLVLGNLDTPTPGGAGLLSINNIRLLPWLPLVVWVSDNKTAVDDVPADQGWVDLLSAQGYNVDLNFRNKEGRTLDDTKIAALNAADLIIISRDTDSGNYANGTEPTEWNSITTPVLMQVAHIAQSSRWLWLNSKSTNSAQPTLQAVAPSHPVFSGVTLDASNQTNVLTTNSSFVSTTDVGNGTLIAKRADNDQVWIAEWQAGQAFYAGSTQTPAGPRMLFCSGGTSGVSDGTYNLTADGEKMFLNAVRLLVSAGTPQ